MVTVNAKSVDNENTKAKHKAQSKKWWQEELRATEGKQRCKINEKVTLKPAIINGNEDIRMVNGTTKTHVCALKEQNKRLAR